MHTGAMDITWTTVLGATLVEFGVRAAWAVLGSVLTMIGFWGLRQRVRALETRDEKKAEAPVTINIGDIAKPQRHDEQSSPSIDHIREGISDLSSQLAGAKQEVEDLTRDLAAARTEMIAKKVGAEDSHRPTTEKSEIDSLRRDFELAPGAGIVAAELIIAQDDLLEAKRVFNIFASASNQRDKVYPYVALSAKFAAEDRLMEANNVMIEVPDESELDNAINWALSKMESK